MAVRFREVLFRNRNSIPVFLSVDAPVGTVVWGPTTVAAASNVTIDPGVSDCQSVQLSVTDSAHHDPVRQTFAVERPAAGIPAHLDALTASYVIGTVEGRFTARTDRGE